MILFAKEHAVQLGIAEDLEVLMHCINMALEEALVNHIKHGHQRDETKTVTVDAYVVQEGEHRRLIFESEDQGPGFTLDEVQDPTQGKNLEKDSGRGLLMMNHYTGKLGGDVQFLGNGNRVRMSFLLKATVVLSA